ncbi:hypothetical protein GCG54_00014762 [Colletotrichum gloeosporioides]|uniref:Gal80p-like C-terminal domain-containing protein n=1 Tax=Colletotrichum gloeosporioides TaxID=474922 RepID=A0A8H4FH08_COLGL|nr:uncharacterized protein GCG54_00014762 [Colletotrichum gloeosporioides]KAF3801546.1 hypothetical protein GCG54_00014762 [Colletotrichum gloeosporioides]
MVVVRRGTPTLLRHDVQLQDRSAPKFLAKKSARIHNLGEDIAAYRDIQSTVSDPNIDLVAVCLKVPAHLPIIEADAVFATDIENGANLVSVSVGHALDALCFVLEELRGVQGTLANKRPVVPLVDGEGRQQGTIKKTSHDHCTVTGRLAGGGVATAVCQGGMSAIDKNFFWEITGTKGMLVLEGPMGNIQGHQPTVSFVKPEAGSKLEKIEVEEAKDFSFNTGWAWDAFAGEGEGAVPDFKDALLRHRMLEAIYRSSEKGTQEEYM